MFHAVKVYPQSYPQAGIAMYYVWSMAFLMTENVFRVTIELVLGQTKP